MIKFEPGEEVVKIIRRHCLVLVPDVLMILVLAMLPLGLYQFFISDLLPFASEAKDFVAELFEEWKVFGYSIWLLMLWIFFFVEWTDYYLDLWVLTNTRIVDVEQKGFFHREVTSLSFSQIQDITVETRGFIETIFKFGTLHVQTAGHNREIVICDAHYPEEARSLILQLQHKSKEVQ